jgi:ubiquinol-cytochrome c reductase cytochrome c subunit
VARGRRALLAWAVLAGLAVVGIAAAPTAADDEDADAVGVSTAEAERGGELYQRWCATCHANDGSGTGAGPPIDTISIAELDLSMRTGRMPLADPEKAVREREFTDAEREATVAYLTDFLDLDGEVEDPGVGDVANGRKVYTLHCAQCHGASGHGGIAGDGTYVPALTGLPPIEIAQGTRVGPFQMPAFDENLVTDEELADLSAFLDKDVHGPLSPLGLGELERYEAAGFAVLLTAAMVALCVWSGRRGGVRDEAVHELSGEPSGSPRGDPYGEPHGEPVGEEGR